MFTKSTIIQLDNPNQYALGNYIIPGRTESCLVATQSQEEMCHRPTVFIKSHFIDCRKAQWNFNFGALRTLMFGKRATDHLESDIDGTFHGFWPFLSVILLGLGRAGVGQIEKMVVLEC